MGKISFKKGDDSLTYSLQNLVTDVKTILQRDGIEKGSDQVCYFVQKALMDQNFIPMNLSDRKKGTAEREILYEDPELGFCVCGHVYNQEANGSPHDHGSSWAVYGQAAGETEMTEWEIVKQDNDIKLVKEIKKYVMKPGDVKFYNVGDVHSPIRKEPVRLLRIEGKNLDNVERSKIKEL